MPNYFGLQCLILRAMQDQYDTNTEYGQNKGHAEDILNDIMAATEGTDPSKFRRQRREALQWVWDGWHQSIQRHESEISLWRRDASDMVDAIGDEFAATALQLMRLRRWKSFTHS